MEEERGEEGKRHRSRSCHVPALQSASVFIPVGFYLQSLHQHSSPHFNCPYGDKRIYILVVERRLCPTQSGTTTRYLRGAVARRTSRGACPTSPSLCICEVALHPSIIYQLCLLLRRTGTRNRSDVPAGIARDTPGADTHSNSLATTANDQTHMREAWM